MSGQVANERVNATRVWVLSDFSFPSAHPPLPTEPPSSRVAHVSDRRRESTMDAGRQYGGGAARAGGARPPASSVKENRVFIGNLAYSVRWQDLKVPPPRARGSPPRLPCRCTFFLFLFCHFIAYFDAHARWADCAPRGCWSNAQRGCSIVSFCVLSRQQEPTEKKKTN